MRKKLKVALNESKMHVHDLLYSSFFWCYIYLSKSASKRNKKQVVETSGWADTKIEKKEEWHNTKSKTSPNILKTVKMVKALKGMVRGNRQRQGESKGEMDMTEHSAPHVSASPPPTSGSFWSVIVFSRISHPTAHHTPEALRNATKLLLTWRNEGLALFRYVVFCFFFYNRG